MRKGDLIIFEAIDNILWHQWDPINLNENEILRDEYKGYIQHVFKLKIEGADVQKIAKHLYQTAMIDIGVSADIEHCTDIAQMILDI